MTISSGLPVLEKSPCCRMISFETARTGICSRRCSNSRDCSRCCRCSSVERSCRSRRCRELLSFLFTVHNSLPASVPAVALSRIRLTECPARGLACALLSWPVRLLVANLHFSPERRGHECPRHNQRRQLLPGWPVLKR